MASKLDKLNELKENFEKAEKEYRRHLLRVGKELIQEAAQALFDNHPELHATGWRQYTPYFNDGDPCSFGVYYEHGFVSDKSIDEAIASGEVDQTNDPRQLCNRDRADWYQDAICEEDVDYDYKESEYTDAFYDLVNNEQMMETIFGDHARVLVHRFLGERHLD